MTTTTFGADLAETRYAEDRRGRFAYRRLGPRSTVPLVMATRFRGTIDHWDPALLDVLGELTLPVLVANGAHDVLIHAYASYAMSQRLPNAKVILYSDAGRAFLFQHAGDFGHEVLNFLR